MAPAIGSATLIVVSRTADGATGHLTSRAAIGRLKRGCLNRYRQRATQTTTPVTHSQRAVKSGRRGTPFIGSGC